MLYTEIESICKERNISIAKLEKDCDIGNATIRRWNKSFPRIDTLKKLLIIHFANGTVKIIS